MTHEDDYGKRVAEALQNGWNIIRANHADVPPVMMITGRGFQGKVQKWGHFHAGQWGWDETKTIQEVRERVEGGKPLVTEKTSTERVTVPELFIAGERISQGGRLVMQTMLHEAAHAVAWTRKVQETSGNGRYHNRKFAAICEEHGLIRPEVPSKAIGYSQCEITDETAEQYAMWIGAFDGLPALEMTSMAAAVGLVGRGRGGKRLGVECQCVPARRLQISPKALETGGIICGVCEERFEESSD